MNKNKMANSERNQENISQRMKNRRSDSKSDHSNSSAGGLLTSKTLQQIDHLESNSSASIDLWKQSLGAEDDDPFKLYPTSNHPSPKQSIYRVSHSHSDLVDERSSLLPNKLISQKSPSSWWNKFVVPGNQNRSMSSSSSSSYGSEKESPSSFFFKRKSSKRSRQVKPKDPYYSENQFRYAYPNKHELYSHVGDTDMKHRIYNVKASFALAVIYNLHYFSAAIYDFVVPHNIWFSKIGLLVNPWIGPSPQTLSKFGILNPAKIIYDDEYWRFITCITLSSNFAQLILNLMTLLLIASRMERKYGSKTIVFLYIPSSLISALLTGSFRPIYISTCASAGIVSIVSATILESHLFSIREKRFHVKMVDKRHRALWRRGYLFSLFVLLLHIILGFCPMVGFLQQASGAIFGYIIGFILLSESLLESKDSYPPHEKKKTPAYIPPRVPGQTMRPNGKGVYLDPEMSPDSPITRRSLILSPDDEDMKLSPLSSSSQYDQKGRNSYISCIRIFCMFMFCVLLILPILALELQSISPPSYMRDASFTNCKFMRSLQNSGSSCEHTCVPLAAIIYAAELTKMIEGKCDDAGYECHIEDNFSMPNKTFSNQSLLDWNWNTDYNPIISIYTNDTNSDACENYSNGYNANYDGYNSNDDGNSNNNDLNQDSSNQVEDDDENLTDDNDNNEEGKDEKENHYEEDEVEEEDENRQDSNDHNEEDGNSNDRNEASQDHSNDVD